MFDTDSGTAVPIANTLDILGGHIVASGTPIFTTGSTNVVTVNIQASSAQAASSAVNMGGASFNNTEFTVDANGFVSLIGGGAAIDSIAMQTGTSPVVPNGSGLVTFNGAVVAAGTNPVRTDGTGANTMALEVQISQAIAATDATKIGLSAFDSSSFSVDANGFVTLKGGSEAIDSIGVDASTPPGTNPVVPSVAGLVTITGAQVAAGTVGANVIRTDSLAANTLTVEIQRSTTNATTDSTKNGVSHFDSAAFDVDANGFVQLNGGGIAATSFDVQANTAPGTDPVVPTAAGVVTVNGAAVANHSVVLETRSRAANTYNLEVQYSAAVAATDATKSGVAHFDSARFTVDANGFVSMNGSGVGETITGNSGGALSPTAGNWNIFGASTAAGTSPVTASGAVSTLTVNVQKSQAIASTDATKVGLSAFDSARFTVDANGFVSANGSGIGETITGQSGGALSPTSGNWNIFGGSVAAGTSPLVSSGAGSTLTLNVQRSQALAAADSTKVGVSNFFSGQFSVDSNGFVTIISGGMPWTDVTTATQALSVQNGYVTDRGAGVTYTLPATANLGDMFIITGKLGLWTLAQNANQQVNFGSASSTVGVGGSFAATNLGDSITCVCTTSGASTIWRVINGVGNITVT